MVVKENMATAQVMVNRTKYDIKYGSGSFFDNCNNNLYQSFYVDVLNDATHTHLQDLHSNN